MLRDHRAPIALLLVISCLALAACGADSGTDATDPSGATDAGATQDATLILDFVPSPVHAGIYEAVAKGYYEDQGINLKIIEPTTTADTLKLIDAGKADFGIADGIDVATQISDGRGAKGIMAIAQRPLGGLITLAESGFSSPADLEGRTVGVTGVPSDEALLQTMVADAGGDPGSVDEVTIGFNGVQDLEAGKIAAFTGFIPADGVQADVDGYPTRSFAFDEYGGPSYPGLVVFSTEDEIATDPALMQAFVGATIHGYEDLIADPQAGLDSLLDQNPAIPEKFASASLSAYLPLLATGQQKFGSFNSASLEQLSRYMVENDLADAPIPPDRYATNDFVEGSK